jgi:hypothetical protein
LLEDKHKEILVKYNVLAKENARNAEMLFNMNTGGNINNYDSYLLRDGGDKQADLSHDAKRQSSTGKRDTRME